MRSHLAIALIAASSMFVAGACRRAPDATSQAEVADPVDVTTATARVQAVDDVLRVTGSLVAEQQAEVAAETTGRVVATPVERGSRVAAGAVLVALSEVEARAQADEAAANVAQFEARLGLVQGTAFDADTVAEVAAARASRDLAAAEFGRIRSLLDERVVSQAEFDQRRMQAEAARSHYTAARNAAQQQYRMLEAARARAALARKNLADTSVRAPFAGVVVERRVGVGDFVTRGTKVAAVVQVSPLRLELTVPEQSIGLVKPGQEIRLRVDAFPGRTFEAQLRYLAPSLRPDQRAMTVEAVVPNTDGTLKPGMFASAEIALPAGKPSLVIPSEAVQTIEGINRVFVVRDGVAEERIVATGLVSAGLTEVTRGLAEGEAVATGHLSRLSDGAPVRAAKREEPSPAAR